MNDPSIQNNNPNNFNNMYEVLLDIISNDTLLFRDIRSRFSNRYRGHRWINNNGFNWAARKYINDMVNDGRLTRLGDNGSFMYRR